ncbi:MAG: transcription termination/antitermination protein NusG, partial [bacterium]
TVTGPLFPGYLFARLNVEEHYRAVTYARGVRRIVAFGSTPATVDEDLIQGMRTRLCNGCVSLTPRLPAPGQVVKIQDGPLSGIEAVFEREMPDRQRVVLLLRTLAYQARVIVPFEQVANL